jgi:Flp pilus assembly protein TadB
VSDKRGNLSPKAWIWYWRFGIVFAAVLLVYGVATGDARMIFLAIAIVIVAIGLIAWYRRLDDQDPGASRSN